MSPHQDVNYSATLNEINQRKKNDKKKRVNSAFEGKTSVPYEINNKCIYIVGRVKTSM